MKPTDEIAKNCVINIWDDRPSGMRVVTVPRGIQLTHTPTGIMIWCKTERSQYANRQKCLDGLAAMLQEPPHD